MINTLESQNALGDAMAELCRRSQRKLFKPMKTLRELFPDPVAASGDLSRMPLELCCDSRRINVGSVFFALAGARADGHAFIHEAISRGALAVVSDSPLPENLPVAAIQVAHARHAMADAARRFYGLPERKLTLTAITGTKGKTTTTYLLRHLLDSSGEMTGMLSTIENDLGSRTLPASRTTSDCIDIAANLAQMADAGCRHCVMEASSHGIDQGRVWGLPFKVALFTNLSGEHLDYHRDMENYFAAKMRLFKGEVGPRPKIAAINLDDTYGKRLARELAGKTEIISFGRDEGCSLRLVASESTPKGSRFTMKLGSRKYEGFLPLVGEHNLHNALGALAVAYALGLNLKDSVAALANFEGVPGRLEKIEMGQPFDVIVDYAHTDEALRCAITALREIYDGRILTVFGCGGNRDAFKRPRMTQVAMQLSDTVIATADNPRREALADIFKMMREGVTPDGKIEFIESRREAIERALSLAEAGDCVLIAGKGHETYQEFADAIVPFDDRKVAREILSRAQKSSTYARL